MAKDVLIASGHAEYPPFMYRKGNQIIGVGVDITKMVFAELDIEVRSIYAGAWNRVQRKARAGNIDLIVGIYKTEERLEYLVYPQEPYVEEPVTLFVRKDSNFKLNNWKDLIGKKGGTVMGESFGGAFDQFAEQNLNIQRLSGITQSFKMIHRNRLDYSIYAFYPGLIKIIDAGMQAQIKHLTPPIVTQNAYQAMSKKSKFIKHLKYLDNRIGELKADGTIQTFIDKHMKLLGQKDL
jgi:polar amino acid transport system substrate-binding protein